MFVNDYIKNAFAKAFYDKAFKVYKRTTSIGVEGDVQTSLSTYAECYGNVQYNTNERVQRDYGIKENIDLVITTSLSTSVTLDDLVNYDGKYFIVKHILTYDSHISILCAETNV